MLCCKAQCHGTHIFYCKKEAERSYRLVSIISRIVQCAHTVKTDARFQDLCDCDFFEIVLFCVFQARLRAMKNRHILESKSCRTLAHIT